MCQEAGFLAISQAKCMNRDDIDSSAIDVATLRASSQRHVASSQWATAREGAVPSIPTIRPRQAGA
jgi:hypothetical protein